MEVALKVRFRYIKPIAPMAKVLGLVPEFICSKRKRTRYWNNQFRFWSWTQLASL